MRPFQILCLIIASLIIGCKTSTNLHQKNKSTQYITILGIAQDGGYPHINNPEEFSNAKNGTINKELVVSLGLVDLNTKKKWLFEATPNMPEQLYNLELESFKSEKIIDGIFLTHAHMGHYTGLMHFGREAMGAKAIKVYAMPRMKSFLEANQPWKQLSELNNIIIEQIENEQPIMLTSNLKVTPFLVPHRDELSETVGYKIEGKKLSALFIPDIDKWHLWKKAIIEEVRKVDYAFLDATFFRDGEIPRQMSEVPHPFISETIKLFENESLETKSKIIFIHFNHSNPAILENHRLKDSVSNLGFNFAVQGLKFRLD